MTQLSPGLFLWTGNITGLNADAIVNAANSGLLGGGGVDGAIHQAGGPDILAECRNIRETKYPGGLPEGEAVATGAGSLKAKYVIHTVGPVWSGGRAGEEQILKNAYRNSLLTARELGCRSIAFPAISTGVYAYPKEAAALVALTVVTGWEYETPGQIILVSFSKNVFDLYLRVYKKMNTGET